ncbi:MAG TPA: murein biosynthesis integral membrane protein MurJ [Symbiobacteriaceae bacterium]|nr:murein biosynthesis integral membrane protein MurJ [Symbiobacteriaceae bacterium]
MNNRAPAVLALVVALASFGSRILGFARESVMAALFGAGTTTDVFVVASTLPVMLFQVVTAALSATIIPVFIGAFQEGRERGFRFTSNLVNVAVLGGAVLWLFVHSTIEPMVRLLAPDYSGAEFAQALEMTRVMLPSTVILTLAALATGLLQSQERFVAPAVAPLQYNVVTILCMVTLGHRFGISALAWGITLGSLAQLLAQWPAIRALGYRHKWVIDLRDPALQITGRLILPVLLSLGVSQVGVMGDRLVLSRLGEGSLSAINYGGRVFLLPLTIFVSAIVTVIYPSMVRSVERSRGEFGRSVSQGTLAVLAVTIPVSVLLLVCAEPVVRLLFERGAFDGNATRASSQALMFYSLGLVPAGVYEVLQRAFFAMHDTKTPMSFSALRVILNIILNVVFSPFFGHVSIALAYTLSSWLMVGLLYLRLFRAAGADWRPPVYSLSKLSLAGAGMALVLALAERFTGNGSGSTDGLFRQVWELSFTMVPGLLVFSLLAWVLREPGFREVTSMVGRLFRRRFMRKRTEAAS